MSRDEPREVDAYERVRSFLVAHGCTDRQVAQARRDGALRLGSLLPDTVRERFEDHARGGDGG